MSEPWLPARALLARRLWDENRVALEDLCAGIAEAFRLPVDAVAATVKRRLMMDVSEGRCGRLRPSLSQAFASLLWITGTAILSLIAPRRRSTGRADILLDQWDANVYADFYQRIVEGLPGRSVAVLTRVAEPPGIPAGIPRHHRPWKTLYPRRIAWRVLALLWRAFLRRRDAQDSVDSFYMAVILLRKIGTYHADVDGLQARLLLSCGDNYFEGVRYAVYRHAGIDRIDVIQNAMRGSLSNDVHLYADTYFAQGEATRPMVPGLTVERLVPVGSFRAAAARRAMPAAGPPRFDIAFIEQLFVSDLEGNNSRAGYDCVVRYLARFARAHPELRICLVTRGTGGQLPDDRAARRQAAADMLEGSGVQWTSELGLGSYAAIATSMLVISYNSTMAFEAALFGRRFLLCLPDKIFHLSAIDGPAMLCAPSYEDFERRVLDLVTDQSATLQRYFEDLGRQWMFPCDDPIAVVRDRIAEELAASPPVPAHVAPPVLL